MEKVRFAPLIRVSTESQEKKGESLKTQKDQIIQYVKSLDGIVPDSCWKYSGQEHATPDQERQKLNKLLTDSSSGKFDAVIVCDASRWSRDNLKSKQGLKILKSNGIRFFVGATEFNLSLPQHSLFLGMSTEMNEFFALEQNLKSMQNRIGRARKGYPSAGKLPFGRLFNKETGVWGIDPDKQKNIQWAAEQYLSGGKLNELAKILKMNGPNLWKVLTKRSGDRWEVHFDSDRLNIHEIVEMKIPPLLPKQAIEAIHARAAGNKTYFHGHLKNQYLLSRMVFCDDCGYAMYGQCNTSGRRYYRHTRNLKKTCDIGFWIPADDLEKAVMIHLFSTFGDVSNLEKAMLKAIPNPKKIIKLRSQKKRLEKELQMIDSNKQRIVKCIAEGIITNDDARRQMENIRDRETLLNREINKILPQLENTPTEKQIKTRAALTKRTIESIFGSYSRLGKMSFEDRRKLVETAFSGKDSKGKRLGIYARKTPTGKIKYTIKGAIQDTKGGLPMGKLEMLSILGIDADEAGDYDPFKDKELNLRSIYQH